MFSRSPKSLIRPLVRALRAYVPGEQPKVKGLVKLNTNENPFPPAPAVLEAIRAAADGRLRLYPDPTAHRLRVKLAALHKCKPENVIVGNGSDELLTLAVRAFAEPIRAGSKTLPTAEAGTKSKRSSRPRWLNESVVQYFNPSYSLYPVLTDMHGAVKNPVSLPQDFSLPSPAELKRGGKWNFRAALTFITTPNAPSGRAYSTRQLDELCLAQKGVVVLDEAYVDFAEENALRLALKHPHVIVSRTFSKAYSLCFMRVGYFIGHPQLIGALHKIRDSYNVNGLGQVAAEATLDCLPHYRERFRRIIATRTRLSAALNEMGFQVLPSQANFVFVKPPRFRAKRWLEEFRARKILVRWFPQPEARDYLRITIGSDAETDALLRATRWILQSQTAKRK